MYDVLELVEAGGLDCWADAQLKHALAAIERVRCRVDACQALVLAELVRRGRPPESMFGSKLNARDAQRRTKTAVALADGSLPGVADALAAGDATLAHVEVLAELKERLPEGAIAELLPHAKTLTPAKFRRAALQRATPVDEAADSATGVSSSGGRWFRFSFGAVEGTIVHNGLETVMDRAWLREHPERAEEKLERPPYGQRMAAALLEMCRHALAGRTADTVDNTDHDTDTDAPDAPDGPRGPSNGPAPAAPLPPGSAPAKKGTAIPARPSLIIVISYEKMFGDAQAAGICTTIDGLPLPAETVRKMLVDANIYPLVVGGDGEILDFGRSRRFFSTAQKKAAAARDLSCAFGDCDNPVRYADYHHCTPFSHGGRTDIANAAPTCPQCHDKLTKHGYRLERRNGTTYTYAPDGTLTHQRNNRWQE